MLYLTCTIISSVGIAHFGVSRSKDWVSVDVETSAPDNQSAECAGGLGIIRSNKEGETE